MATKKSKLQQLAEIEHAKGVYSAHVIDLDRDSAQYGLDVSVGNRTEGDDDIDALTAAMDSDRYIFDGNPCSFERRADGQRMFDGHHRCKARLAAKTNKPIMTVVTFNSPADSQRIRVSGRRWTPRDWASRLGHTPAHAYITTSIHRAVDGKTKGKTRDAEILAAMAIGAAGINAVVDRTRKHNRLSIAPITAGIAMAWLQYPEASSRFLDHYINGGRPVGCPANTLREHVLLHGKVASQQSVERIKLTWSTITAVALFAADRETKIVRPTAASVEAVLHRWGALRNGKVADVADWMRTHQKKRHEAVGDAP